MLYLRPQLQDQRSSWGGEQPQSGDRMRGPDGSRGFSLGLGRDSKLRTIWRRHPRGRTAPIL
jgi:hypothetical protein